MINNQNTHHSGGGFSKAAEQLATILAIVATVGLAPLIYHATHTWVHGFLFEQYGGEFLDLMMTGWGLLCAAIVFTAARAALISSLLGTAFWVAEKFIGFN